MRRHAILSALCILAAACDPAGGDRILDIDSEGTVEGVVFLDLDASSTPGPDDGPAVDLLVALVVEGTTDTVASVRTDAEGFFSFPSIDAGTYDVVIPPAGLSDSIRVVYRDPPGSPIENIGPTEITSVTVGRDDSVSVTLGVSYFIVSVEEARALPNGRRVFVRGLALNTFQDGDTLSVQGDTRALRILGASGEDLEPADSALVLGTVATRDGQPVLLNGSAQFDGSGAAIDTLELSAGTARTAGGGVHDAQLVSLHALLVTDTATIGSRFIVTTEDPSGTIAISAPVSFEFEFAPGDELDVIGILVPATGVASTWQVRPRTPEDVTLRP